jgi:Flp pilus assembly protein TadG
MGRLFARHEGGVTAIEIGILGVPFFALIAAIMESAMIFFASQVMDGAVDQAARDIRTGQAQSGSSGYANTLAGFQDSVCNDLFGLFDCSQLEVKVSLVTDFSVATAGQVLDSNGNWLITPSYTPGTGGQVVMVQVYYKWPTLFNFAGFNMANTPDGKSRLMSSVRVFMNEPFT